MKEINPTPLENQVGGHHCIISLDGFVLKPYNEREVFIYSIIPIDFPQLCPFIVDYFGVYVLPYSVNSAITPITIMEKKPHCEAQWMPKLTSISKGIIDGIENEACRCQKKENQRIVQNQEPDSLVPRQDEESAHGQWLTTLYKRRFNAEEIKFIKLRDLTKGKNLPCILDIKVGLRRPKLGSKEMLEKTTSGKLKFRICGMSVHEPKTCSYIFRDKYWGRRIQETFLQEALSMFFYDGEKINYELLIVIVLSLDWMLFFIQSYII